MALFTDSFLEANGVATFSREFLAFASRRRLPFLCVFGGKRTRVSHEDGIVTIELKRGAASFPLDHELRCDPLLVRFKSRVTNELRVFRPDVIQITGPGDVGVLGFWIAHTLRVPLAASWHTNLHEYAARRLERLLGAAPARLRSAVARLALRWSLDALVRFYRLASFTFAPNENARAMLARRAGRPAFPMEHGVDCALFAPERRAASGAVFTIGYAGRLTPEKGVRVFAGIEQRLLAAGRSKFRIVLMGEGSEKPWLRAHLRHGEFPGILRGGALAEAFAGLDAFVFPSATDTFGLVLLEAMASGVPVLASAAACERTGVRDGIEGIHADSEEELTRGLERLMDDEPRRGEMARAARETARRHDWSRVFDGMYETYHAALDRTAVQPA